MTSNPKWPEYAAIVGLVAALTVLSVHFWQMGHPVADPTASPSTQASAEAIPPQVQGIGVQPDGSASHNLPPLANHDQDWPPEDLPPAAGAANTEPAGPLSVSGLVVDEGGRGVAGIEVNSQLKHAFSANGGAPAGDASRERRVLTDIDGFYEIRGMADGEYRVRTLPTDHYDSAMAVVRAGTETADLVVRARRPDVLVYGAVRSEDAPLEGVEVLAVGQSGEAVLTDSEGRYELDLDVGDNRRAYTLRFVRDGFREARASVDPREATRRGRVRVDTEMEPLRELVDVSGRVIGRDGEAVPDQTVQFYSESTRQRYTAVSQRDGAFWLEDVEASADYLVTVHPKDRWRDFRRHGVEIALGGADLEVMLEPLAQGRLSGQMVDPEGRPVPQFSLWLRNPGTINREARLVTGDQQGFFRVDSVEAGELVFETRSSPLYSISGIRLADREDKEVTLVLDWGAHRVAGLVIDEGGQPVPASELFVTSVRRDHGLRAHVIRRAVTDQTGFFLFDRVGTGYHTIRVTAPGFRAAVIDHEVGREAREIIIRLERVTGYGM